MTETNKNGIGVEIDEGKDKQKCSKRIEKNVRVR
jgi:hypothetical protein